MSNNGNCHGKKLPVIIAELFYELSVLANCRQLSWRKLQMIRRLLQMGGDDNCSIQNGTHTKEEVMTDLNELNLRVQQAVAKNDALLSIIYEIRDLALLGNGLDIIIKPRINTPIVGNLPLPTKISHLLADNGIATLLDLVQKTTKDLKAINGFGKESLQIVLGNLPRYNLRLGMKQPEIHKIFVVT